MASLSWSCSWFNGEETDDRNDTIVKIIDQDINNENTVEEEYIVSDYQIPVELVYNEKTEEFLIDKLYPIGWSKDGKFAYIIEPADEGSGFYLFELVVFDMVNNKASWSWKPDDSEEGDLESTWKENYSKFKESLNKYEIKQKSEFELKKGKTSFKGNEYQLVLDTKTESEPDFGFDVIKEMKVSITSVEIGTKEIYNHKEDFSMIVGAFIPGYLLSEENGRIIVICQKERVGYEGPPNVVYFDLIGSDLTRGFKADDGS